MEKYIGVASFKENIVEHLKKYSDKFRPVYSGEEKVRKYLLFKGPRSDFLFFMISQTDYEEDKTFNVMISVFGYDIEKIKAAFIDFENKMPFNFFDPPEGLKNFLNSYFEAIAQIYNID